jgi:cardiolipin synthase
MNTALKKAKNKVKIKPILAGIFRRYNQTRNPSYLRHSLDNIELYEWDKTVLHGKAAVVDGPQSVLST